MSAPTSSSASPPSGPTTAWASPRCPPPTGRSVQRRPPPSTSPPPRPSHPPSARGIGGGAFLDGRVGTITSPSQVEDDGSEEVGEREQEERDEEYRKHLLDQVQPREPVQRAPHSAQLTGEPY